MLTFYTCLRVDLCINFKRNIKKEEIGMIYSVKEKKTISLFCHRPPENNIFFLNKKSFILWDLPIKTGNIYFNGFGRYMALYKGVMTRIKKKHQLS